MRAPVRALGGRTLPKQWACPFKAGSPLRKALCLLLPRGVISKVSLPIHNVDSSGVPTLETFPSRDGRDGNDGCNECAGRGSTEGLGDYIASGLSDFVRIAAPARREWIGVTLRIDPYCGNLESDH